MRQVIENLLSNAVKFTARGSISLSARAVDDAQLLIEIEDTGPGIGARDLPHIFEEYRQAGTLTAKRRGTGLGLAICKHLVTQHRGKITVSSELGRGTCFSVLWPISPFGPGFAERSAGAGREVEP
jgi:signal transduction histidine kinase